MACRSRAELVVHRLGGAQQRLPLNLGDLCLAERAIEPIDDTCPSLLHEAEGSLMVAGKIGAHAEREPTAEPVLVRETSRREFEPARSAL